MIDHFADSGRWITIGGHKSDDGERHGGSPVFVKDGKIVKGHPSLTGQKVGSIGDKSSDESTHRQQLHQSKGYEQAVWKKKARTAGVDPGHLDHLAGEIMDHDKAFIADRMAMLREARGALAEHGGDWRSLTTNVARGRVEDAAAVKGIDEVAADMEGRYPHLFDRHTNPSDALFAVLSQGNPEPMSRNDAYQQAFDHLQRDVPAPASGSKRRSKQPVEEVPFTEDFQDDEPFFEAFRDELSLRPMPPLEALRYFLGLVPQIGVDPERWGEAHERHAFTLAADVNGIVLDRVHEVLASILRSGDVPRGPALVDAILDEAGLSPRDPSYGELVVRTNLMDSYSTGAMREMQHPDVRDTFPVWKYLGIHDGRQRKSHEVHFDKYFSNDVTFAEVRDSVLGKFDGFRCRCFPQAIDKFTWAELQAQGHEASQIV